MSGEKPTTAAASEDLGGALMAGASWMVAMRWSVRALGMVNTLILVRLLSPEDFGVVAMAMIVYAFISSFNEVGLDMALIRLPVVSEQHYHTAWTLTVGFGLLNSLLLIFGAPLVASFFDDPRLEGIIYALAVVPLLNGLANTRLADFRRELDFVKDFRYNVISRALALPLTIALAVLVRNYWALVAGMIVQAGIALALGYRMRPFCPRICFKELRSLLGFSVWVQVRNVGTALGQRLDQLYIGKLMGARELGGYQVCQDITEMATTEVVLPLGRALLPGYSRIMGDSDRMRSAVYRVMEVHVILAFALAGGLTAVAGELIGVLMGDQWRDFVTAFQALAWAGGVAAVASSTGPVLVALGEMRLVAFSVWLRFGFSLLTLTLAVAVSGSLLAIAVSRVAAMGALLAVLAIFTVKLLNGRLSDLGRLLVRPMLASVAMMCAVAIFQSSQYYAAWAMLPLEVALGIVVYTTASVLLWLMVGRPEGAVSDVMKRAIGLTKQYIAVLFACRRGA
jgi:lipopolysaccharide exporter